MKAAERLSALFVAPPHAPRRPALRAVPDAPGDPSGVDEGASVAAARGRSVCVVGGSVAAASALAAALAARLARGHGARCALLLGVRARGGRGLPATPAARRRADRLRGGGLPATARGRVVHLACDGGESPAGADIVACDGVPRVAVLLGARGAGAARLPTGCDLVIAVVADDAPDALRVLAAAELAAAAPGAVIQFVTLRARGGAGARRAAVARALAELR